MIKLNVEMLNVWSVEEVLEDFCNLEKDVIIESGVYKIDVGCRGGIDDIVKCDVVDGFIEVYSEECIREELGDDCDEDFVSCYLMERGLVVDKNMYYEGWFEESCSCYVRVEV